MTSTRASVRKQRRSAIRRSTKHGSELRRQRKQKRSTRQQKRGTRNQSTYTQSRVRQRRQRRTRRFAQRGGAAVGHITGIDDLESYLQEQKDYARTRASAEKYDLDIKQFNQTYQNAQDACQNYKYGQDPTKVKTNVEALLTDLEQYGSIAMAETLKEQLSHFLRPATDAYNNDKLSVLSPTSVAAHTAGVGAGAGAVAEVMGDSISSKLSADDAMTKLIDELRRDAAVAAESIKKSDLDTGSDSDTESDSEISDPNIQYQKHILSFRDTWFDEYSDSQDLQARLRKCLDSLEPRASIECYRIAQLCDFYDQDGSTQKKANDFNDKNQSLSYEEKVEALCKYIRNATRLNTSLNLIVFIEIFVNSTLTSHEKEKLATDTHRLKTLTFNVKEYLQKNPVDETSDMDQYLNKCLRLLGVQSKINVTEFITSGVLGMRKMGNEALNKTSEALSRTSEALSQSASDSFRKRSRSASDSFRRISQNFTSAGKAAIKNTAKNVPTISIMLSGVKPGKDLKNTRAPAPVAAPSNPQLDLVDPSAPAPAPLSQQLDSGQRMIL